MSILVDKMMQHAERSGKARGHLGVLTDAVTVLVDAAECALPRPLMNGPISAEERDAWSACQRVRFLLKHIEEDMAAHEAELARRERAAGVATADQTEASK